MVVQVLRKTYTLTVTITEGAGEASFWNKINHAHSNGCDQVEQVIYDTLKKEMLWLWPDCMVRLERFEWK